MAHKNVLDAHALIWYLEGNARLGTQAQSVMSDPASSLCFPPTRYCKIAIAFSAR